MVRTQSLKSRSQKAQAIANSQAAAPYLSLCGPELRLLTGLMNLTPEGQADNLAGRDVTTVCACAETRLSTSVTATISATSEAPKLPDLHLRPQDLQPAVPSGFSKALLFSPFPMTLHAHSH